MLNTRWHLECSKSSQQRSHDKVLTSSSPMTEGRYPMDNWCRVPAQKRTCMFLASTCCTSMYLQYFQTNQPNKGSKLLSSQQSTNRLHRSQWGNWHQPCCNTSPQGSSCIRCWPRPHCTGRRSSRCKLCLPLPSSQQCRVGTGQRLSPMTPLNSPRGSSRMKLARSTPGRTPRST